MVFFFSKKWRVAPNIFPVVYIYIYIIIKSHCKHWFPWLSFSIHPHHPSLPAGLLNYIPYPGKAAVGRILLVGQHWHGHIKRSIGECHLWVRPWFSSRPACLVRLTWIVLELGSKWLYSCDFVGCCFLDGFNIARRILVQFLSSTWIYF